MNMIKVNFIPQETRKSRGSVWQDGFGSLSREAILGILVAGAGVLLFCHVALAGLALVKYAQHTVLQVRWGLMGAQKKVLDDVTSEIKLLHTKMNTLRVVTSQQGVVWARLMNEIADSVPKGVWIRQISFEKSQLVIEGSAVSKDKNEMIIVNNFVSMLKEQAELKKAFIGIDVASIERRDNTALSIADFTLNVKRRAK
ncbi:MAG: PilN domain-containing protein [Candidatus Omnitrophica bacterium]|nr:PilN domain-containing protein [Candidatus Omnitrophota bacterium]